MQVVLPPRSGARKIRLRGVFKGATVVRSSTDWKWGDQDGGKGNPGIVVDILGWEGETARSIAQVQWAANGRTDGRRVDQYRLGHKGKVDVKLLSGSDAASGGACYPDHLPVLAHVPAEEEAAPAAAPAAMRGAPSVCSLPLSSST